MEIRQCTEFDIYSAAKDPLPYLLDIIQTYQLAPTGDPLVDADVAINACHTMTQLPGEPAHRYRIKMEDKIKVIEKLDLDVPTQ